jgi:hypothetical protein
MSGAEPMAVLGAISSVIAIIETSKEVYDAAKNAKGLHESFRKTSDNVSIILSTLYQAKLVQEQAVRAHEESEDVEQKLEIEQESRAVEPIMNLCKTNAEVLSNIFATVAPNKDISRIRRYANAIENSMPSKKRKVQSLMRETMEGLQLLHTYHSFSTMTTTKQLQAATKQLSTNPVVSDGGVNRRPFHQQSRTMDDHRSFAMQPKQTGRRDFGTTKSSSEGSLSLDKKTHNVWVNASGTKVMNQIGAQTVHGSQNFTL